MPRLTHRVLIPLAALAAILPLLLAGPSCGHDFDFHLLNWLEANTQLAHLQYPHWAYTPAYNAGEPRFLFYPPISWLLGAALTAILPFHYVPIAFTFLALTLAGFALHRLARPYTSAPAAAVAAVLYLLNPYMLFTAYERTAYAELLAAAIIPLLFAAIITPRPTIPAIAIPLALVWLTNAPAAVMTTYALALLTLTRLWVPYPKETVSSSNSRGPSRGPSRGLLSGGVGTVGYRPKLGRLPFSATVATATALGLLLPAFYLLPAAYERRFVQINMAVIPGMTPADNFLFHRTGLTEDALAHDAVLHTASLIALLLLAATAVSLLLALLPSLKSNFFHPEAQTRDLLLPLSLLAAAIAFLLTPPSLPLWTHLPQLAFLQFPWRLLALVAPILALATALALKPLRNPALLAAALAALLIPTTWHLFHQPCDLPDTPESRLALYHSPLGTEPTDEYTPTDADNDALHPPATQAPATQTQDPAYWLIPPTAPIDTPAPPTAHPGSAPNHLALTLPAPETLILNRRRYPLWLVTLNGHTITLPPQRPDSQRQDGLMAIPLPAGLNIIDLRLRTPPDELLGLALTLISALLLFRFRNAPPTFLRPDPSKTPANPPVNPQNDLSLSKQKK